MSDALGVVAEAHAVRDADGEPDDVLDRAAEFAADDVGVGVRAEVRGVAGGLEALGDGLVGAGDDGGGRLPGGDLPGEVGAGDDGDPLRGRRSATSSMTSLIRFAVPSSTPFIRETSTVPGASSGAHSARLPRRVCEGTARTVKSAPRAASAGSVVARRFAGSSTPGQVVGVRAGGVDRLGEFGAAAPEGHLAAGVGEHHREGGAPRAGAEDGRLDGLCSLSLPLPRPPCGRCSVHVPSRVIVRRSAGAFSPRSSSSCAVIAAMMASVASLQHLGGRLLVVERATRSTGGPACTW